MSTDTTTQNNPQPAVDTEPAEELGPIDNTQGRGEPTGIIWHLANFAPAIIATVFIAYTAFLVQTNQTPTTPYLGVAMLIGALLIFVNTDRDVYFKRLYNLQSALQEHNVKLTNKTYTSYKIHYPDNNPAHTDNTESTNDTEVDQ